MTLGAHLLYALAWAAFGTVHSVLAAGPVKAWLRPTFGAGYRLAYNLMALAQLALAWAVGQVLLGDEPSFSLAPWARVTLAGVQAAGWFGLAAGLTHYDLARLAGTRQIRDRRRGLRSGDDEPLRRDGLLAHVRHPLYAAGFLVLWGRATDPFGLATAVWGSLYLMIGSRFEERRLMALHGAAYADYRRRVPAFVPWRWRGLSRPGR